MNYILEANIGIVFFCGLYFIFLRDEADFRRQRLFLLFGLVCSLIFPMVHIQSEIDPIIPDKVATAVTVLPELVVGAEPTAIASPSSRVDFILLLYIAAALIVATPIIIHGVKLYYVTTKVDGRFVNNYWVIESPENVASWSFFRTIFLGRSQDLSESEKKLVLTHEMEHGRLLHSFDMLFMTILCIVFWFNPAVWIYRRVLARVHEFEVDAAVAGEKDPADYCELLAKTALQENGILLSHHFNQSFILKRINMINMIKQRISAWKISTLIATAAIYFAAVACTEQVSENGNRVPPETPEIVTNRLAELKGLYPDSKFEAAFVTTNDIRDIAKTGKSISFLHNEGNDSWAVLESNAGRTEPYTIVQQSSQPAKGMTEFFAELNEKLEYPEEVREAGKEGKIFIEFIVRADGRLSDFHVVKTFDEACSAEAIRVMSLMGKWTPAMLDGKAVDQRMVMPITFKLD